MESPTNNITTHNKRTSLLTLKFLLEIIHLLHRFLMLFLLLFFLLLWRWVVSTYGCIYELNLYFIICWKLTSCVFVLFWSTKGISLMSILVNKLSLILHILLLSDVFINQLKLIIVLLKLGGLGNSLLLWILILNASCSVTNRCSLFRSSQFFKGKPL